LARVVSRALEAGSGKWSSGEGTRVGVCHTRRRGCVGVAKRPTVGIVIMAALTVRDLYMKGV